MLKQKRRPRSESLPDRNRILPPMNPPKAHRVLEKSGPPVLVWTDSQEREYLHGNGPPPFA